MRARTLLLLIVAVGLAGGTMLLARAWLSAQRTETVAQAAPAPPPIPAKSILVAKNGLPRGQIIKPDDLAWQPWPEGRIAPSYIQQGTRTPESYAGWVARLPVAAGEPLSDAKIVAPGNRGFLAAVLRPGMRAISVPVTVTSGISGFIFPGDAVDLLITYGVPSAANPNGSGPGAGNNQYEHKAAETVLRDVRVIAIDQRLDGRAGEAVVAHTATLEVTPKQSEVIALASEIGKLSLSLRSLVPDQQEGTPAETAANPSDSSLSTAAATVTLDSEVSPLLPKTSNHDMSGVIILRGGGKGGDSAAPQPASRGS